MDKVKIARSFSRAAASYDQAAWFQRQVGEQLLELWQQHLTQKHTDICVDLGCGTGSFVTDLHKQLKPTQLIGLDLAEGMLHHTQQQNTAIDCICADAEYLPLADNSVDAIYSNMAVQWCEQLPRLFAELYRIIKPGGQIALTSLGPGTLIELKQSWAQVDGLVHVNQFQPLVAWQQAIMNSGFSILGQRVENPVLHYQDVYQLLNELKQLGAHNVNDGQRLTLTGRQRLKKLLMAYERFLQDGGYPATYEMFYWILEKK